MVLRMVPPGRSPMRYWSRVREGNMAQGSPGSRMVLPMLAALAAVGVGAGYGCRQVWGDVGELAAGGGMVDATDQEGMLDMSDDASTAGYRELTSEEERVILHKGTEAPFSGEYDDHFEAGLYVCRRCGAMLYRSIDKLRSRCGWPAFDDEIPGAVERVPDSDGVRTEIVCAHCGGHLGHVFTGEGMTPKDTRHCVNSLSLLFVPEGTVRYGRAYFAGGCFWGVEYWMERVPGVLSVVSGYMQGRVDSPRYEDVCRQDTGHAEAVEVTYDPVRTDFETLAKLFFEIHDPTQVDRQGPDVGHSYRSGIYTVDGEQERVARALIARLRGMGLDVATEVEPAKTFWPAEGYHQDYYRRRGDKPYCHIREPIDWSSSSSDEKA